MPADHISATTVTDDLHGVSYPQRAVIWVGPHSFEASEPADWQAVLQRAGMSGGTILIPDNGTPGDAWREADLRLARLVICSCGDHHLDPDTEGFDCLLCARCYTEAGWENTHSDNNHDRHPDPHCPICNHTSVDAR
jgi:hypothetical protein